MSARCASPLRILVVHNRYRSETPSGEDRVVDQETALLTRAGHEVTLFERRSDDIASMSLPAKLAVPLKVPWNRSVRVEFEAQLRATKPDIVHVHNTFPLVSPSVLAACAEVHAPVIATLHNYLQTCATGTLFRDGQACHDCVRTPLSSIRHACYRGSRVATVPRAVNLMANRRLWWSGVARFFCVSECQRQILIQAGMPAPLLSVKPNFVTDPVVTRTGPGAHLLFVGRMTTVKGLPLLMAAWDQLAAQGGVGVPLVLAGAGDMAEHVAGWARGRPDVQYLGLQTKDQCQRLTARASAVVVPSTSLEPFGLTAVEAMAARVPTVAAAHGALAELVQDGVTGILHRPFDVDYLAGGIRRVVTDASLNRSMGDAARDLYEHQFTPSVGLQALETGYRAVIVAAQDREAVRP